MSFFDSHALLPVCIAFLLRLVFRFAQDPSEINYSIWLKYRFVLAMKTTKLQIECTHPKSEWTVSNELPIIKLASLNFI